MITGSQVNSQSPILDSMQGWLSALSDPRLDSLDDPRGRVSHPIQKDGGSSFDLNVPARSMLASAYPKGHGVLLNVKGWSSGNDGHASSPGGVEARAYVMHIWYYAHEVIRPCRIPLAAPPQLDKLIHMSSSNSLSSMTCLVAFGIHFLNPATHVNHHAVSYTHLTLPTILRV